MIGQDQFGATGNLELLTGLGVVLVIFAFPEGVMGFLRPPSRTRSGTPPRGR